MRKLKQRSGHISYRLNRLEEIEQIKFPYPKPVRFDHKNDENFQENLDQEPQEEVNRLHENEPKVHVNRH